MKLSFSSFLLLLPQATMGFVIPSSNNQQQQQHVATSKVSTKLNVASNNDNFNSNEEESLSVSTSWNNRRSFLSAIPTTAAAAAITTLGMTTSFPLASYATGSSDGNLPDLPSEAVRSYLQYRIPLQVAADYYIFDMQSMVGDVEQWGEVGQLFRVNNNKGQGSPSRIERDYVNPMRVLLLSMPPDISDDMREAQFRFEKAMNAISKATSGYRKDLPVEIPASSITIAKSSWEEGRVALNDFFALLNETTGLNELRAIPPAGPNQRDQYGRSYKKYNDLVKKTKLCQNRGGPALSQAWGQLMVSGYMQDSCGIPDLDLYFYQ